MEIYTVISTDGGLLLGVNSADDIADLPTDAVEFEYYGATVTRAIKPWDVCLVGDGSVYYFNGEEWAVLGDE